MPFDAVAAFVEIALELFTTTPDPRPERMDGTPVVRVEEIDGVEVRFREFVRRHGDGTRQQTIELHAGGNLPIQSQISVLPQGTFEAGQDLVLGDPEFDELAVLKGPDYCLSATFDKSARARLGKWLMSTGGRVAEGRLEYTEAQVFATESAEAARQRLSTMLDEMVKTAISLSGNPVERLAGIAATDPYPLIRARALLHLRQKHPGAPQTAAALQSCGTAPDALVQAVALGDQQALAGLVGAADEAQAVLAIRGLGLLGGADAVESLLAVSERFEWGTSERKAAARAAITGIHSRLSDAASGGLSLAEAGGEAGGITLVETGALSLKD
jgi:hypothetical protein